MISSHDIRKKYLDFLAEKKHAIVSSASLLPDNDPTTLFTGSGMQPMVPYLLGQTHPQGTRIADSQKCFRAVDMDEVGDNRHTTFFEMLGNWSLGDYFKTEQINWMWKFLVEHIGLDPNKLYVTCYAGSKKFNIAKDLESAELWKKLFNEKNIEAKIVELGSEEDGYKRGMNKGERIFYYEGSKNWWSRGGKEETTPVGDPCGPDSEMFYMFENIEHDKKFGEHCHPNCDCGRFTEIGNNVFMAYKKTASGFEELVQKNVDFGGGLERIAAAVNDNPDMFLIDLFGTAREKLEVLSGKKYIFESGNLGFEKEPECWKKDVYAFRVILDHIRAATFLIADGAIPDNKDQGYFTRRLLRRAVRFGLQLGIEQNFLADISRTYIETYKDVYSALETMQEKILLEMNAEEEKFRKTLKDGLKEFEKLLIGFQKAFEHTGNKMTEISGKQAFKLYDTYGFPYEMTEDLAHEHGLSIDKQGFDTAFEKHKDLSREGAEQKFKGGLADTSEMSVKYHTATHLLHIALRKILGDHVEQKGSNITPDRLRFDFSHDEKMTDEQKKQVEDLVNGAIARDYSVSWQEMPVEEALGQGVIGLFADKYDDVVKVYTVGDPNFPGQANPEEPTFSREICGGPHVEHTGVLGHFRITKEESSSAGIRRIKAVLE